MVQLLRPLAALYALLLALRRLLYRLHLRPVARLPVPVVVVGNFRVGGTGKTPLVVALAQALSARGHRVGVVSRGYGGRSHQPRPVRPDSPAREVGDEPVLIARATGAPVWVGRDRAAAARALLGAHPDVDLVLLDDGLQHLGLARTVEIAVYDARGCGNGYLLPAGPLRERPRAVDALVRNGAPAGPGEFPMALEPAGLYRLDGGQAVDAAALQGLRLHAAAGIGHPQRFFDTLRDLGLSFTAHAFADHHDFSAADLRFAGCDAILITEKDAVKCASLDAPDLPPLLVLRVQARLSEALLDRIGERLRAAA